MRSGGPDVSRRSTGRRRYPVTASAARLTAGEATGLVAPAMQQALPPYLAPKRQRRAYGDKRVESGAAPLLLVQPGTPPSLNQAIGAMLNAHGLDWATTQ